MAWSTEVKFRLSFLFIHPHGKTGVSGFPKLDEFFDHNHVLSNLASIDSHLPAMVITGLTDLDQRPGTDQHRALVFLHKPVNGLEFPANKGLNSRVQQARGFFDGTLSIPSGSVE